MSDPITNRRGSRPRTTSSNPHRQLDQIAPIPMQEALAAYMFSLPCVEQRPSAISVPGARAMWLHDSCPRGDDHAFMIRREFAHLHPHDDGSLHMALPEELARQAAASGWAEPHPMAALGYIPMNVVMVYGPRDEQELEVVKRLVRASLEFAHAAAS